MISTSGHSDAAGTEFAPFAACADASVATVYAATGARLHRSSRRAFDPFPGAGDVARRTQAFLAPGGALLVVRGWEQSMSGRLAEQLAVAARGKFIVLDGPDGAGKSTQHRRLEAELKDAGVDVASCRDPGGTAIGDRIRSVLLDHDLRTMDVNCETMLFMASRAQLAAEVIRPALSSGKTVLCDRFVTATCAYQGAAGYDPRRIIELAEYAIAGTWPDVTIILDVAPENGFERIGRKAHHAGKNRKAGDPGGGLFADAGPDAMEARPLDYHRRVRKLFLEVGEYFPRPVVVVDASGSPDDVYAKLLEGLVRVLS